MTSYNHLFGVASSRLVKYIGAKDNNKFNHIIASIEKDCCYIDALYFVTEMCIIDFFKIANQIDYF